MREDGMSGKIESMTDRFSLHPAKQEDFDFCERLYFDNMGWIIKELDLDLVRHREGFAVQWQLAEVRIIAVGGEYVGWLQTEMVDDVVFLKQLYLDVRCQRQGIGSEVMQALIEEATRSQRAVYLAVVKINPARRLYERLGFRVTGEDQHKVYMRRP
jgi:ribosomal protein S18 acetylase RimI-like enzyme